MRPVGLLAIGEQRQRCLLPHQYRLNAKPLSTGLSQAATRSAILNERLFEFAGEAKRRQDTIRLGGFIDARQFKLASAPYKVLFPVPITQIQNNPLITQNAGY